MKPRYIQGVAVLLWGVQTDLLLFAVPMAILLEARYAFNRRWALTKQDFYRVADLTSIGFVGLITYLFINAREFHFITTLIQLLPIVFFPLVVVLAYSTSERMSLDVLFYSLRRQREPVRQSWDMDYVFIGICLIATATNTSWSVYFLPAAAAIICWALFPLRSDRYQKGIWILVVSAIFLSASFTQQGIKGAHEALKERSARWIANWLRNRVDPMKTSTSMGEVGQMKLSDAIVFRVQGIDGDRVPTLLQEASYDLPSGTDWMAMTPSFEVIPHADDFIWHIGEPDASDQDASVYLEFNRSRALVPVPPGVTRIVHLPAQNVRASEYGSIQGTELVPSPRYQISFNPQNDALNDEPEPSDLFVPEEYVDLMTKIAADASFSDGFRAMDHVRQFFTDFRYSLYQDVNHAANPLEYFLLHSRQGHCEYFASATTLMLRQLGVPARYVVGYAIQEYDSSIEMYVVRQRHAHAWSIAFVDGQWHVVDTTPAVWAEREAAASGFLRPVQDFMANRVFLFQLWWNDQELEDYQIELSVFGAILVIVLVWRIYTSEQVILERNSNDPEDVPTGVQGLDSPFFRVQQALEEDGFKRGKGEVLRRWLRRIDQTELIPMLDIHNRWRFDPRGVDEDQKRRLQSQVRQWFEAREQGRPS